MALGRVWNDNKRRNEGGWLDGNRVVRESREMVLESLYRQDSRWQTDSFIFYPDAEHHMLCAESPRGQ